MKKVLIVASVASMIDQFLKNDLCVLKELGYEIEVAANFCKGNTSSIQRVEEFKIELKKKGITSHQIDFSRNVFDIKQNLLAFNQVKKLAKENNFELIHSHSPIGGVVSRLAALRINTKSIYTAHGFHFYKGSSIISWILFFVIEKILSYKTDMLITINEEDYNRALNLLNAKQTEYVPGIGVDLERIGNVSVDKKNKLKELLLDEKDFLIISVGELNSNKNHETIINSMALLKKSNIHYLICGQGDKENYLRELSKKLNLESQVHFLGFRNDIIELLKISNLFAFPSYREGLSVALMESLACGLPVVCSDIRGNRDLVTHDVNGYLIKANDKEKFACYIREIYENPEKAEYFKLSSLNYIHNFSDKVVKSKILTLYKSLERIESIVYKAKGVKDENSARFNK